MEQNTSKILYLKEKLTDKFVKSLESQNELQIRDTEFRGFFLRYYPKTKRKSFFLHYRLRVSRIQRNLHLGYYGEFSMAELRERVRKFRQMAFDGYDPMRVLRDEEKKRYEEQKKDIKVKDVFTEYLEKYSKIHKKKRTYESDCGIYRRNILPNLGDMFITSLNIRVLNDYYGNIVKKTSFNTANHDMALISSFWNWAEQYEYLPLNSNPCKRVKKGKDEKIEYVLLDMEGYKNLFASLEKGIADCSPFHPRMYRAIKILALTGCRCGEIIDLRTSELDLEHNLIALQDSKTGARHVPIGDVVVKELKLILEEKGRKSDCQYVFPATRGEGRLTDLRKAFRWALTDAGLPMMRIHDLRHSFASLATNMGEDIHAIQKVLGHSRTSTTEIYAHLIESKQTATANKVSEAIAG